MNALVPTSCGAACSLSHYGMVLAPDDAQSPAWRLHVVSGIGGGRADGFALSTAIRRQSSMRACERVRLLCVAQRSLARFTEPPLAGLSHPPPSVRAMTAATRPAGMQIS